MKKHMKRTYPMQRKRRIGFTMAEMSVAIAISGIVAVAVTELMMLSARAIKSISAQTRTRSARMISIDQIRYQLANCEIGSVVGTIPATDDNGNQILEKLDTNGDGTPDTVFPAFHGIQFTDPTRNDAQGSFTFIPDPRVHDNSFRGDPQGELMYDADTGDATPPIRVARGPVNVTFVIERDEIIRLRVRTAATVRYAGEVDTQDGVTKIYLRNQPTP